MSIRIGYACINTLLQSPNRTCRLNRATPDRILEIAGQNLTALEEILHWNLEHHIRLFRISSEIIPFGSHPVNQEPWWEIHAEALRRIGALINANGMRVSMHPGQYTVLNSLRPEVVQASVSELVYHARFLDSLGVDASHKIVLHVGGVFGDKPASLQRFLENYQTQPGPTRARLVVENDEKSYSLEDTVTISAATGVPVVFDVFHHRWNPSFPALGLRQLVERAAATWGMEDGRPKLHYSDQRPGKPPGAHSEQVDVEVFGAFLSQVRDLELDIMLEVKDKEQSVLALQRAFPELAAE